MADGGLRQHSGSGSDSPGRPVCTDRAELIERIKRGESPTWLPNPDLRREYLKVNGEPIRRSPPRDVKPQAIPLLPAAEVEGLIETEQASQQVHSPFEIQRPRSALHAGDFTEEVQQIIYKPQGTSQTNTVDSQWPPDAPVQSSSTRPWSPPTSSLNPWDGSSSETRRPRDRAPSISTFSSSSYVLRPPTTPLVQQSNNADLDFSSRDRSASPDRAHRRPTLPPQALHDWPCPYTSRSMAPSPPQCSRSYRPEVGFPRAHQARRSITSTWSLQHPSSPPNPALLRSRRPSCSSEASPRQRASMIGSYEESILRGRMSTAPSKPFDFSAHIGALGKGKRPKMPAHITVPFQAVFYDWSSNLNGKTSNDEPSPYVGHIDLQNMERTVWHDAPAPHHAAESSMDSTPQGPNTMVGGAEDPIITSNKPLRRMRTRSSLAPPTGSYRIPEQGQIQVVVKNAYKTALKLFLVPYDLTGMEAGQKTFVRQRYYSGGPVIEKPIASESSHVQVRARPQRKPTLRYLIHLNVCCPSKGRFYLYQHIRVVFANRVPDDQEYLTKEVQEPHPKYSPWKPNMDCMPSSPAGAKLTVEKAFRRCSSGFSYGDHPMEALRMQSYAGGSDPYPDVDTPPLPPIPFRLPHTEHYGHSTGDVMDLDTSWPTPSSDPTSPGRASLVPPCESSGGYTKLQKGDAGYGGVFGRPGTPEPGEGLLARRLRGLDMPSDITMGRNEE
ncbi:MAG: hypothetical protein Q9163_006427 [Psora crenata]